MLDTFFVDSSMYIIYEEVSGAEDLCNYIAKNGRFTEKNARCIMCKLFSILLTIHSMEFMHGDLKAENLLFSEKSQQVSSLLFKTRDLSSFLLISYYNV